MSNGNFHQLGDHHFLSPASTTMATQPSTPFANTTVPPITPPTVVNGGGSPPPMVTLPSVGETVPSNDNNNHHQHPREEPAYLGSPTASAPGTTAGSLYDCRGSNLGTSASSTFGSRSQLTSQRGGSQHGFCDPAAALMASPQRATELPMFHSQPLQQQAAASRHQPLRRTGTGDSLLASRTTATNTAALRGALSPNDGPSSIASDLCDLGGGADLGDGGDTWERPQSPLKPPESLTTNAFAALHLAQSQDGEDQA